MFHFDDMSDDESQAPGSLTGFNFQHFEHHEENAARTHDSPDGFEEYVAITKFVAVPSACLVIGGGEVHSHLHIDLCGGRHDMWIILCLLQAHKVSLFTV